MFFFLIYSDTYQGNVCFPMKLITGIGGVKDVWKNGLIAQHWGSQELVV